MLVCDVGALEEPDVVAVDAVARLQLTARRLGSRICVRRLGRGRGAPRFTGLAEICGLLERKTEKREDPLGVEEEGELDDPPAELEHLSAQGSSSPPGTGRYCPNAGEPFAASVGTTREFRHVDPRPEPPGEDVVAPREPEVVGRHRLRGVLVDERGQRVHVVALESLDVALE